MARQTSTAHNAANATPLTCLHGCDFALPVELQGGEPRVTLLDGSWLKLTEELRDGGRIYRPASGLMPPDAQPGMSSAHPIPIDGFDAFAGITDPLDDATALFNTGMDTDIAIKQEACDEPHAGLGDKRMSVDVSEPQAAQRKRLRTERLLPQDIWSAVQAAHDQHRLPAWEALDESYRMLLLLTATAAAQDVLALHTLPERLHLIGNAIASVHAASTVVTAEHGRENVAAPGPHSVSDLKARIELMAPAHRKELHALLQAVAATGRYQQGEGMLNGAGQQFIENKIAQRHAQAAAHPAAEAAGMPAQQRSSSMPQPGASHRATTLWQHAQAAQQRNAVSPPDERVWEMEGAAGSSDAEQQWEPEECGAVGNTSPPDAVDAGPATGTGSANLTSYATLKPKQEVQTALAKLAQSQNDNEKTMRALLDQMPTIKKGLSYQFRSLLNNAFDLSLKDRGGVAAALANFTAFARVEQAFCRVATPNAPGAVYALRKACFELPSMTRALEAIENSNDPRIQQIWTRTPDKEKNTVTTHFGHFDVHLACKEMDLTDVLADPRKFITEKHALCGANPTSTNMKFALSLWRQAAFPLPLEQTGFAQIDNAVLSEKSKRQYEPLAAALAEYACVNGLGDEEFKQQLTQAVRGTPLRSALEEWTGNSTLINAAINFLCKS